MKKLFFFVLVGLTFSCITSDETIQEVVHEAYTGNDGVTIGKQVWMNENLNVDKFRNGDIIPQAKTIKEWQNAGYNKQPAWCYYNNDPAYGEKYGKLYNWYALNDARGLAPDGWHLPTDAEWTELQNYLKDYYPWDHQPGLTMKSSSGWKGGGEGTNESGFNGLPGGVRYHQGMFEKWGYWSQFWSSTEIDEINAWSRSLDYKLSADYKYVNRASSNKEYGLSVRCLRD